MVAAGAGFIWHASQVSLGRLLDVLGADEALLTPCLALLMSGGSVQGCGSEDGLLVVVKDIRLRCAHAGVNYRRPIWALAHEELSDEPAAAEGTDKTAPLGLKWFYHGLLLPAPQFFIPLSVLLTSYLPVLGSCVEASVSQVFLEQPQPVT